MKCQFSFITILFLVGCATPGVSRYDLTPAERYVVGNEILVNQPFEQTWDRLVERLASSFYVINNIDKASRLINLSFSSNEPEKYIDCGESSRHYERGGEHQEFRYKVAQSSSFKIAGVTTANTPMTTYIERKTSLEGRANIYVAPSEGGTKITVNVRYVLNINTQGQHALENRLGQVVRYEQGSNTSSSVTFSTNVDNKENLGTMSNPIWITCYSSGKLEESILDFARTSKK